ncbi:MAG TPA: hypothetical protein VGQ72_11360 [Pyrinomonadaceae bacterium]|nr:hypothetical protein [Pyrinomonadaceae bacterium]
MIRSKKKVTAVLIATVSLLVLGVAGSAQRHLISAAARPEVKVQLSAAVERDAALLPLDKANAARPGEVLDWTITSENSGNGAAFEYKAVGHIPRGTEFVAGTAKADGAKALYSIDNGKSFSDKPTIEEKQSDGTMKRVAAPVAMYTDVRYEWADALAPGGKLSASYKVRVK